MVCLSVCLSVKVAYGVKLFCLTTNFPEILCGGRSWDKLCSVLSKDLDWKSGSPRYWHLKNSHEHSWGFQFFSPPDMERESSRVALRQENSFLTLNRVIFRRLFESLNDILLSWNFHRDFPRHFLLDFKKISSKSDHFWPFYDFGKLATDKADAGGWRLWLETGFSRARKNREKTEIPSYAYDVPTSDSSEETIGRQ